MENNEELEKSKKEAIEVLKPTFEKYNALDKENAIMEEEIFSEVNNEDLKKKFNLLKSLKIIKKHSEKYYYVIENENNMPKKKVLTGVIVGTVIAISALIVMFCYMVPGSAKLTEVSNEDVSFKIEETWNLAYDYSKEYGWDYYRYINTLPSSNTNTASYENYPASINVYYEELTEEDIINSIEDLKNMMDSYIKELSPDDSSSEVTKTKKGYDALKYKLVFYQTDDIIGGVEYIYYILYNNNIASLTGLSYCIEDEKELEQGLNIVTDNFEWQKDL